MPAFPDTTPDEGLNVNVTLSTGAVVTARYESGQWWVGIPDQDDDVPIDASFVVTWDLIA